MAEWCCSRRLISNVPAKQGAIGMLDRIIERVRAHFPKARILVRLDAGFAGPELLNCLEESEVDYLIGMGANKVVKRRAKRLMGRARPMSLVRLAMPPAAGRSANGAC